MHALSNDLLAVMERHLRSANPRRVFEIAAALCATSPEAATNTEAAAKPARLTVYGDLIYDSLLDLTWTRGFVPGGKRKWEDAVRAASEFEYRGRGGFRAPTVSERLSISDFGRFNPAIDTSIFECPESGWEWTGSIYKPSPAGCAWGVGFGGGYSDACDRDGEGFVRAVCPGQLIGTWT
jgi:hypothetical protein